jgi:hypothetical protein
VDSVPAVLRDSLARVGTAAVTVIGSPDIRERLVLAEAGKLDEDDAASLGSELDRLAVLLTR